MIILITLFSKIISLLLLFQLLIVSIGLKIRFNAYINALKLPLRTSIS
jgi:hypothetical protein